MKVDENFGKPMANSHLFKDISLKIKVGSKRTHNEMTKSDLEKQPDEEVPNLKRKKFDEISE